MGMSRVMHKFTDELHKCAFCKQDSLSGLVCQSFPTFNVWYCCGECIKKELEVDNNSRDN